MSSGAKPTKASGEVSAFMELASTPASMPRTRSDRWFHVKPRLYSRSTLQAPSRELDRPRGFMVAGPSVLTWGPAAPSPTYPQTPAQRREADGRGQCRPLPRSTHSASGGRHWSGLVRASRWFQATPQPAARLSRHPTFWRVMHPQPFRLTSSSVRRCSRTSAMTDKSVFTCFT